ncbi:spore germination protein GerPC [Bacillus sp. MRMR6]|uniref:spore germination protein GerPC n=1 Tax=Bacillus sp. MRMR6 TaxID=1928617 RepID=UPI000950C797|nr:spore germination protein GerPC [Bacillus sp. MRMR6]OLS36495.1 spore gernimation protein [Bacillus sp. MRMR6]
MYQDYSQMLQWLQMTIQAQENRIAMLEQTLQKMSEEIKQIKGKPSINVEKIEYKFDQLKVETLDGTLNIGLNPSDLSAIEDFAVQNQSVNTPFSPKMQMQRTVKIEDEIFRYLESDLPALFEDTKKNLNVEIDDSYLAFIKQDIQKQLPSRIEYHLKAASSNGRSGSGEGDDANIIELIKQEIQNGVTVFINHLPENAKGMKQQ